MPRWERPHRATRWLRRYGVEAGGDGINTDRHSATLTKGTPGVLHGTRTYLLQDTSTGQITETHSISAGCPGGDSMQRAECGARCVCGEHSGAFPHTFTCDPRSCTGLDYPGVGPEHAWLKDSGRCTYVAVTDKECLEGFKVRRRLFECGVLPLI